MKRENLTEIGRVKRTHGLHGHIKVVFDSFYINFIKDAPALILEKGEDFLPFFIEEIDLSSQPPQLKFESINHKEEAQPFNGKPIYMLTSQLPQIKENQLELLENMIVFDERDFEIGHVEEVMELPSQLILRVLGRNGETMIPFHEDFIIDINPEENRLQLQLPEGLLDIYS